MAHVVAVTAVVEPGRRRRQQEPDGEQRPRRPSEQPVEAGRVVRLAAQVKEERVADGDGVVQQVRDGTQNVEDAIGEGRHELVRGEV